MLICPLIWNLPKSMILTWYTYYIFELGRRYLNSVRACSCLLCLCPLNAIVDLRRGRFWRPSRFTQQQNPAWMGLTYQLPWLLHNNCCLRNLLFERKPRLRRTKFTGIDMAQEKMWNVENFQEQAKRERERERNQKRLSRKSTCENPHGAAVRLSGVQL